MHHLKKTMLNVKNQSLLDPHTTQKNSIFNISILITSVSVTGDKLLSVNIFANALKNSKRLHIIRAEGYADS